jgi:hypothetical protein
MKKLLVILTLLALPSLALAHPGGRDAYGGHYDATTGKYHVHEGPLEGRTYNSQENMIKVLRQTKGGPAIIRQAEQGGAQNQKAATPSQQKNGKSDWTTDLLRNVLKQTDKK